MSEDFAALTPEQRRTLTAVLDELVPPSADGRLPGAGALGLADAIEEKMREQPDLRPAVLGGLEALDALARRDGGGGFADVAAAERAGLLSRTSAEAPAFLPGLIFHAYVTYYHQAPVLEGLGVPGRPPHPEGYAVAASDDALLDPVRAREPLYRPV
ncbi:MAG TPA: gluconate 2-dehydrogenase subunit 3 family protein [Myxococcota bacterium]|nr:gluconate 2-dehydrogenase subunit 3 family protein [Myxococcota bacterium]